MLYSHVLHKDVIDNCPMNLALQIRFNVSTLETWKCSQTNTAGVTVYRFLQNIFLTKDCFTD